MEPTEPKSAQPRDIQQKPFSRVQKTALTVGIAGLAVLVVIGLVSRRSTSTVLAKTTERAAIPTVNTMTLKLMRQNAELVLPGNTTAYADASVRARASGYLKTWYVDIGGHARQGQPLALIETPELDHQVEQAKADLVTAEEAVHIAQITANRYEALVKQDSVSRQETDQNVSDFHSRQSALDSARANLLRLEELQSFEEVTAPFSGVITARNTDIGSLIDAGAGAELFHISDVSRLRIYVSVPEADLASVPNGAPVNLTLDEYSGRTFKGLVVRNADAIDLASRTMRVEIDLDNPKDEVKTGAYVLAHFKLASEGVAGAGSLYVPANALLFRSEGLTVATFQGGRVKLVSIIVGRDLGSNLEVVSGLRAGDKIILNPSDSLTDGAYVNEFQNTSEPGRQ